MTDLKSIDRFDIVQVHRAGQEQRGEMVKDPDGEFVLFDDAAKALADAERERDRQKNRGDNHWETLRSIREIARTSGDLERIIQWVSDAGSGYTATAEATLAEMTDRAQAAEYKLAEVERERDEWKTAAAGQQVVTAEAEREIARAVEAERLRFEGDLDKWMKIIGAGITGSQPEAYALMDLACEELVSLRAKLSEAVKVMEFYANPGIYKPHPHGPAFDRRDLSLYARNFIAGMKGGAE